MNLFVAGWNLPEALRAAILVEMRRMTDVFPQLDPDSLRSSHGGSVFAGWLHPPASVARPHAYADQRGGTTVLYDGSPVDPTGRFAACSAAKIASRWQEPFTDLEGLFTLVRADRERQSLAVVTDPLGMGQVYYRRDGPVWIVSNSAHLAALGLDHLRWDPLGVSLLLNLGWVGGNRTLLDGVHVLPGGEHWRWSAGVDAPDRLTYFGPAHLTRLRRHGSRRGLVQELTGDMVTACRSLGSTYPLIRCGLTGGRDSRLVAALATQAGLDVQYYTTGAPGSLDVEIARGIASHFGWVHEVRRVTSKDVLAAWPEASQRLVLQNDGLASLWQVADVVGQDPSPKQLPLFLSGVGGQIARSFYGSPQLFGRNRDSRWVTQYLVNGLLRRQDGLLTEQSRRLAADHIRQFVDGAVAEGSAPVDVPDLFYAFDRVRRWGGTALRKALPECDVAVLLCSRPFITAAFTLSAVERAAQPLHYAMLRELSPELHRLPFDKPGWPRQNRAVLGARMFLRRQARHVSWPLRRWYEGRRPAAPPRAPLDQAAWLEGKREDIVQACLDRPGSSLWDQIDRSAFESLMARGSGSALRRWHVGLLLDVATLFAYEEWERVR